MSTTANEKVYTVEPTAIKAWSERRIIYVELTDGRIIGFPADRFKILKKATDEQLKGVELRLDGFALRWEVLMKILRYPELLRGIFSCHYKLFEI